MMRSPRRSADEEYLGVFIAELRGVGEQVGERLDETRRVCIDDEPSRGDVDGQALSLSLEERARHFDRLRGDHRELDVLGVQLDLAARDPRDVEQVVDQTPKVRDLPIDQLQLVVVATTASQDLERGNDRRERIAQFMAEHGHELVLVVRLALGAPRRFFVRARFRDVLAHDQRVRTVSAFCDASRFLHPHRRSVLADLPKDLFVYHAGFVETRGKVMHHEVAVFGMNDLHHALAEQLTGGVAEVLRGVVVDAAHRARAVDGEEHRRGRVVEQPEAGLALSELELGLLAFPQQLELHQAERDLIRGDCARTRARRSPTDDPARPG